MKKQILHTITYIIIVLALLMFTACGINQSQITPIDYTDNGYAIVDADKNTRQEEGIIPPSADSVKEIYNDSNPKSETTESEQANADNIPVSDELAMEYLEINTEEYWNRSANAEANWNDVVLIDAEGTHNGKPFMGSNSYNQKITLENPSAASIVEGIVGMHPGEVKDIM